MKKIFYLLSLSFFALGFVACEGYDSTIDGADVEVENPATLMLSETLVSSIAGEAIENYEITITANYSQVEAVSNQEWCTTEIKDGILYVSVEAFEEEYATRNALIAVTTGEEDNTMSVNVVVFQAGSAGYPYLIFGDEAGIVDAYVVETTDGASISELVAYTTSSELYSLSVVSDSDWCVISQSILGISITANQNQVDEARTAVITATITAGVYEESYIIEVTQGAAGEASLTLSETQITLTSDEQGVSYAYDLTFDTNREDISYSFSYEEDAEDTSWCSVISFDSEDYEGSASGDGYCVEVNRNPSDTESRSVVVTITAGLEGYEVSQTLTITQEGAEILAQVGDYITTDDGQDKGIIYWISDDWTECRIMSLESTSCVFSTEEVKASATGGTISTSGADNLNMTVTGESNTDTFYALDTYSADVYPAVAFCKGLGDGWYLPTLAEMAQMTEYFVAIYILATYEENAELADMIASGKIDPFYNEEYHWSSTESSSSDVYAYKLYGGIGYTLNKTSNVLYVRASKYVDVPIDLQPKSV